MTDTKLQAQLAACRCKIAQLERELDAERVEGAAVKRALQAERLNRPKATIRSDQWGHGVWYGDIYLGVRFKRYVTARTWATDHGFDMEETQ